MVLTRSRSVPSGIRDPGEHNGESSPVFPPVVILDVQSSPVLPDMIAGTSDFHSTLMAPVTVRHHELGRNPPSGGYELKSEVAEPTSRELQLSQRELKVGQDELYNERRDFEMEKMQLRLDRMSFQMEEGRRRNEDMKSGPSMQGSSQQGQAYHSGVSLPKIEIPSFDGSPLDYWSFKRSFDVNIVCRVQDDALRYSYLQYYCRGNARTAIKGCAIMDSSVAYTEAWRILESQFGKPHKIVHTILRDLLEGGQLREDLPSLQSLARNMRECHLTLTQMGKGGELDSSSNLLKLTSRLPNTLRARWVEIAGSMIGEDREPVFTDILDFVEKRIIVMDNIYGMSLGSAPSEPQPQRFMPRVAQRQASRVSAVIALKAPACAWCQRGDHGLAECKAFASVTLFERREFIFREQRCFLCLVGKHFASECDSKTRCSIDQCGGRHHVLFHNTIAPRAVASRINSNVSAGRVRLGFITVVIKGPRREVVTNALVDNGSDVTLLTNKMAKLLGLEGEKHILNIKTLHGMKPTPSKRVAMVLGSVDGIFSVPVTNVFTVDSLPCANVDAPLDLSRWSHLKDVRIKPTSHSEVGLLIGCDVPEAHWVLDQRIGGSNEPLAVKTPFGWTVRGRTGGATTGSGRVGCINLEGVSIEDSLEAMYRREFSWPGDGDSDAPSKEDARALAIVEKSTRMVEGRYEVGVPWRHEQPQLLDNRGMAERRVNLLRKRLEKDKGLLGKYITILSDHLQKGYISMVRKDVVGRRWYLPHHPVLHPRKPSKVRIVFDCAAKFRNRSLNDEILSGPNLNNDLTGVLLRFREGPVATAADIEEMFLRVRLPEKDRWAFSFLWWTTDDLQGNPRVFQWNVHPFGATSSPFCAAFALRRAVADCSSTLLRPSLKAVEDNFYVDDCLLALLTREIATIVADQLRSMLSDGGFRLTKWISNDPKSLCLIPEKDRLPVAESKDLVDKNSHSTLGLTWNVQLDTLRVDLRVKHKPVTRRGVLACVASFFDPLGIIGPILLPARQFLQKLCYQGLGWDSKLEVSDSKWWEDWLNKISGIPTVEIPRYALQSANTSSSFQLHVFSDASETGYGAVAYVRIEGTHGDSICRFVIGKARVVPRKQTTIPRLELTAAVLGVKLMRFVEKESRLSFAARFLWTDSQIVLQYIGNTSCRFKTYVANRVAFILEHSSVKEWSHVPTSCNPADLASRGTMKMTSSEIELWLKGPTFLTRMREEWPGEQIVEVNLLEDDEVKRVAMIVVGPRPQTVLDRLLAHYSTWSRLLRGVTWMRRFIRFVVIMRVGSLDHGLSLGPLSVSELDRAEKRLVSLIQHDSFEVELSILRREPNSRLKTSLARLKPVIQDGLLCLGGRLPRTLVILPQCHAAVDRLIGYHHEACGHMGASHVLANLRRKYWIVKGMSSVRRIIGRCLRCRVASARPSEQVMASLPAFRIDEGGSPFLETGVDYFGPFEIKKGRTTHKRYGCLFTCMKTRAVHIEVAQTLSTDSFMMALMRFVGRRGTPLNIYSDNGSNFVGAEADLKRQVLQLNQRQLSVALASRGISWHFNPPHASHRGGVWERMIRTTRRVLSAVVKHQALTDESLVTFMIEAERLINDRPIAPVYDDPMEPKALRPSDLLLLRSNEGIPSSDVTLLERYTKAWRQAQHLASVFWKRWVREYLPTLQLSSRWNVVRRDVRVGDLVLLIGGTQVYGKWQKGVVEEVVEGHDGHIRDVSVRTSSGTVIRDIRSITLLEAEFDVA